MVSRRFVLLTAALCLCLLPSSSLGQDVDLGGRAYVDYFYHVSNPSSAAEGLHGFQYRRLYLTSDFTISEAVSGRARLEANDGTVGPNGPEPVVKDLYITWRYSGEHSATVGVTPPPAFGIAEDVWGYRSLEKTILDLQGIVDSRDFGLRLDGPLTSNATVQYALMYANNSGLRPETDKYKRVYGQLHVTPTERITLVGGADYAGYQGRRDYGTRMSAFAGYSPDRYRVGLETYWSQLAFTAGGERTDLGASLFGRYQLRSEWEVIVRLDRSRTTARTGAEQFETTFVGGVAYQPYDSVKLIPNLRLRDPSQGRATTTARLTAEIHF